MCKVLALYFNTFLTFPLLSLPPPPQGEGIIVQISRDGMIELGQKIKNPQKNLDQKLTRKKPTLNF